MAGFRLFKRHEDIVRWERRGEAVAEHRIIDLFNQVKGASAWRGRLRPDGVARRGNTGEDVTEQMAQEIEMIVSCYGVLTRVVGVFSVEDACADGPRFWRGGRCARLRPPSQ